MHENGVVAVAAEQSVVAGVCRAGRAAGRCTAAVDRVVTEAAEDVVGVQVSGQEVGILGADRVVDHGDDVAERVAGAAGLGRCQRQIDRDSRSAEQIADRLIVGVTCTARDGVGAGAARHGILAGSAADQRIGARFAINMAAARTRSGRDRVVASAAPQSVVVGCKTNAAGDCVVAVATIEELGEELAGCDCRHVGSARRRRVAARQRVVTRVTHQDRMARTDGDRNCVVADAAIQRVLPAAADDAVVADVAIEALSGVEAGQRVVARTAVGSLDLTGETAHHDDVVAGQGRDRIDVDCRACEKGSGISALGALEGRHSPLLLACRKTVGLLGAQSARAG